LKEAQFRNYKLYWKMLNAWACILFIHVYLQIGRYEQRCR